MAEYSLKYQSTFDPLGPVATDPIYKLEILEKNYTGTPSSVTAGAAPVLHQWQTDDPFAPIKGSSLNITLINPGHLPLDDFFSVEDDEFKVRFWYKDQLLFEGFIVQDDCNEQMVDFTHEIHLSATDNLGLIKNVKLDQSPQFFSPVYRITDTYTTTATNTITLSPTLAANIMVGDKLQISNLIFNVTYTVADVSASPAITIVETVSNSVSPINADITVLRASLIEKITLAAVIKACLLNTGLTLNTYVWGRINEVSNDYSRSFLEQTLINPQSFMKDSTNFDDCYSILTQTLGRFNMTLFQAKGNWHIMRWDELRYYGGIMQAFVYDINLDYAGTATMDNPFFAGADEKTYPENGLIRKILRPLQYSKETFNYRQPAELLRNGNLLQLGPLIKTYTIDIWITRDGTIHTSDPGVGGGSGVRKETGRVYEYKAPYWYQNDIIPVNANYFIRIYLDNIGREFDRKLVIVRTTFDFIKSYPIEVNAGDQFSFSFTAQTSYYPIRDPLYMSVLIQLFDGANTWVLQYNEGSVGFSTVKVPKWILQDPSNLNDCYIYSIPNGQSTDPFQVDIANIGIPVSGVLTVNLSEDLYYFDISHALQEAHFDEIYYKDMKFDYVPLVNQSTRITGQTHKSSQTGLIKQVEDVEIFIDDSPRSAIAGTLFLNQNDGLVQKRTSIWQHPYLSKQQTLGNLITYEQLFWRQKPRTILEGTFYGLTRDNSNPYNCNYAIFPSGIPLGSTQDVNFTFDSVPPGTDTVSVGYFDGMWHDFNGVSSSPRILTIPRGTYLYRITFVLTTGATVIYYFNPANVHISVLSVFNYTFFAGIYFVPGTMEIDYRNNKFTGTIWEIFKEGETDIDLPYLFNYIYSAI